jgi:CheY-like chemotaxis protein
MQMPETPLTPNDIDMNKTLATPTTSCSRRPSSELDAEILPTPMSKKRERTVDFEFHPGPPLKRMFAMTEAEILRTYYPDEAAMISNGPAVLATETIMSTQPPSESNSPPPDKEMSEQKHSPIISPVSLIPTRRRVVTREFMRGLVNEALRNGHPTSEVHKETDLGEKIEVRTIGSRGEVQDRTIHLEIEPGVPDVIITEEQHLQFALQKLVDNAIKFTECGSITITVKIGKSSQVVEIWVVDTGCGIAEESKSNLFKPHFQEDASISRSKDGLGLSLFNAKAHVRKNLGGDVTLERSDTEGPCKGSEFLIRLPISNLDAGNTDTPLVGTPPPTFLQPCHPVFFTTTISGSNLVSSEPMSKSSSPSPRQAPPKPVSRNRVAFNPILAQDYPLNILIAEDNAINRNVAVGTLNKLGYSMENITVAFDGVEAVSQYRASLDRPSAQRFNAILMDIWMPHMDGYEAAKHIMQLADENGETIKIIAVTADITDDSLERAKTVGMQGFLAKPYKVLDMENLIVENFQKRVEETS